MARKIIQLFKPEHALYALCDDSTIWLLNTDGWSESAIPPIPQPKFDDEERKRLIEIGREILLKGSLKVIKGNLDEKGKE